MNEENTLYVNSQNEDSMPEKRNESTEYVGKHQNDTTSDSESTVYIGRDSDSEYTKDKTENNASDIVTDGVQQSTVYVGNSETSDKLSNESTNDDNTNEKIDDSHDDVVNSEPEIDRSVVLPSVSEPGEKESEVLEDEKNGDVEIAYYLPTNTMLQKRYRINSVIGEGGFGITYSGWDITLNIPVAIKEYYPSGLVTRNATFGKTTQVVPISQAKYGNQFRDGIDRVLDEARRTAKFRNTPGIVGIYDFFEANNTAYIVMEFVDGVTLDVYYKNNRIDNTTLFNMLVPIMDALQALHNEGIIHRDISPDNIMVDKDGNFKLLDFGAARGYSEESSTTMSIILKKSYAPEEQFRAKGNQGPWTDVYALGASIYDLITGETPPSSIDRLVDDEIVNIRVIAPSLTKGQAEAIMKALEVRSKDRWQSVSEFKCALLSDIKDISSENVKINVHSRSTMGRVIKEAVKNHKSVLIICLLSIICIFLLIALLFLMNKEDDGNATNTVLNDVSNADNSSKIDEFTEINNKQNESDVEETEQENYLKDKKSVDTDNNHISGVFNNTDVPILMEYIGCECGESFLTMHFSITNIGSEKVYFHNHNQFINDNDIDWVKCDFNSAIDVDRTAQVMVKYRRKDLELASITQVDSFVVEFYFTPDGKNIIAPERNYIEVTFEGLNAQIGDNPVEQSKDKNADTQLESSDSRTSGKTNSTETINGIMIEYPDKYYDDKFVADITDAYITQKGGKYKVFIMGTLSSYLYEKDSIPVQSRRIYYYLYDSNNRLIDDEYAISDSAMTASDVGKEYIFDDELNTSDLDGVTKIIIK